MKLFRGGDSFEKLAGQRATDDRIIGFYVGKMKEAAVLGTKWIFRPGKLTRGDW